MNDSPTSRPVYIPNGEFIRSRFVLAATAVALVAALLAAALAGLNHIDGYAVGWIWLPIVGSLYAAMRAAVRYSQCRHRGLACVLGLLAGLIVFTGMYHIDQCSRWDVGWARFDLLPGFITFRMETDGWWARDGRMPLVWPVPPQKGIDPWLPRPTEWNWHWAALLGEIGLFVIVTGVIGWKLAAVPFDEELGVWMTRVRCYVAPGEEPGFLAALDTGNLRMWAHELKYKPAVQQNDSLIAIWYVSDAGERAIPGTSLFVSFGNGPLWFVPADQAAALAEQSQKLMLLQDEAEEQPAPPTLQPAVVARPAVGASAELQSISLPPEWGADLRKFRHRFLMGVMEALAGPQAFQLILVFLALGMAVYLGGENPRGPEKLPWVALIAVLGIASTVVALFTCGWSNVLRYKAARMREALQRRENVGFDPDDPRVILVHLWLPVADDQVIKKPTWQTAFLLLDEVSGEARLEAEFHRVVIPTGAITGFQSTLHQIPTIEGSSCCVLSVQVQSESGRCQLEIQVESGIAGATYHDREEALRVRWQHLVDGRRQADE